MSTKIGDWNISYKKGHMIMRQHIYNKYKLDLSDLPDDPLARRSKVIRRLQDLHVAGAPEIKIFDGVGFSWLNRLADAVLREAEVDT